MHTFTINFRKYHTKPQPLAIFVAFLEKVDVFSKHTSHLAKFKMKSLPFEHRKEYAAFLKTTTLSQIFILGLDLQA